MIQKFVFLCLVSFFHGSTTTWALASMTRRTAWQIVVTSTTTATTTLSNGWFTPTTMIAHAASSSSSSSSSSSNTQALVDELKECRIKLEPIPDLLDQMEWDKVRTILKVPPVNKLWNLGDSQNTVLQLAKESGNIELFELKDDLALTLQLCDQYTYNNAFVYFQPGNGKYNIKEPQQLAKKAMKQLEEIIQLIQEG